MKSFEELKDALHREGVTVIEYNNMQIACIILNDDEFNALMKNCSIRPCIVDSRLDIWHDNGNDVFVNIVLEFQDYKSIEVLLYANECIDFFEALAESGIIALMPEHYEANANIFMIQLAKKDKMEEAYDNIKAYMKL
jgi:hypothetical protein